MDLWCMHAKSSGFFLRNSLSEKPICRNSRYYHSITVEMKVPRHRSCVVKAMAKKDSGDQSNQNSGLNDDAKSGGDGLKGNNPMESHRSRDASPKKPHHKPLNWREFRAMLYIQEQDEVPDSSSQSPDRASPVSHSQQLPLKWAHPVSAPENGCLLVATEKLDGVRSFERTVILLLRSGTRNPQEGPFGIIINRPLNKKMKHINPSNNELATTFADCCLHFGGPLDASMFLVKAGEASVFPGFEEVIPGVCFGSRNSLDGASELVRKGYLKPQDFGFFMGYAGWQLDQLRQEIEADYWCVAACSANLISVASQNDVSSDNLWQEVLQLMGGHYSELSRKPKQDF